MTRDEIVREARACLGTRFRHQGRMRAQGLDCVGLLVWVAQRFGLNVKDCADYDRRPAHGLLELHLENSRLKPIPLDEMDHGDIALFCFFGPPQHVAVMAKRDRDLNMIHAYLAARKVVEHRMDDVWRNRLIKAYRFPGV